MRRIFVDSCSSGGNDAGLSVGVLKNCNAVFIKEGATASSLAKMRLAVDRVRAIASSTAPALCLVSRTMALRGRCEALSFSLADPLV